MELTILLFQLRTGKFILLHDYSAKTHMPGFTLIYQQNGLDDSIKTRAERLVKASFKIQYISKTEHMLLLFRDGNHYPYEIIERKKYIVIIEGRIYGFKPSVNKIFLTHIEKLFQNDDPDTDTRVLNDTDYFRDIDGEFNIYIIGPKGKKIVMLNDYLGRLPVYIYHKRQFILSRDMFILDKITTGLLFDDASIYQYLRIGFPVGVRTLYHDIDRLKPSTVISIANDEIKTINKSINLDALENTFDYKIKPEEALYEIFRKAVRNRFVDEERVVLSLSGGLDSRVIIGEIEKTGLHADYATFDYENSIIKSDVEIVKILGRQYSRSPNFMKVNEWSPEFFDEFTSVNGGMNYLGMAFILHFLKNLGSNYELMITGDGGDKTLPGLYPDIPLEQKKLANYILKKNTVSSKKALNNLFLFDAKEEEEKLSDYLINLPGKDGNSKYKYFLIFERGVNWLFEGEDRNRGFIWSTTPFNDPKFFRLAHSVPEKEKSNFKLFRSFTKLVDKELNKIPNANWGIPLESKSQVDRMLFRQKIKNRFGLRSFNYRGQSKMHEPMTALVISLMNKGYGGQLSIYADQHDLRATSDDTLFHLLSLLKVSEMTWKNL